MATSKKSPEEIHSAFQDTHWSVVLAARETSTSAAALETLCHVYWYPLYAFVRRHGHDHHAAQDLTQEFFARLLDKRWLDSVAPEKGRFRTFLLTAMEHLLANDWRDARAAKRGGGQMMISLEATQTGADRFDREPNINGAPEHSFDRTWALTVMDQALTHLQKEFAARGKAAHFEQWKVFLSREATAADCEASARHLGLSNGAVSVAVHRMRQRYGELLRETVAHTVADAADVVEELRYLFALCNE